MPSVTQSRLDAYLAAERAILDSQEFRRGDTTHRMTELAEVRDQIDKLQRQLSREQGRGGLNYALADFTK